MGKDFSEIRERPPLFFVNLEMALFFSLTKLFGYIALNLESTFFDENCEMTVAFS